MKLGSEERAEEGVGSSKCCHFSASSSTPCSVSDLESGWVGTRKEDEEEYIRRFMGGFLNRQDNSSSMRISTYYIEMLYILLGCSERQITLYFHISPIHLAQISPASYYSFPSYDRVRFWELACLVPIVLLAPKLSVETTKTNFLEF